MDNNSNMIKLNDYSFLELFIATLKKEKLVSTIDKSFIEGILFDFYILSEYKILFEGILDKVDINCNSVNLSSTFLNAYSWGLLDAFKEPSQDIKYIINISDKVADGIIKKYDVIITSAMKELVKNVYKQKFDRKILEEDYPEPIVTKETLEDINSHQKFYANSPVRTRMARIYTTEEYNKRSKDLLNKELP